MVQKPSLSATSEMNDTTTPMNGDAINTSMPIYSNVSEPPIAP